MANLFGRVCAYCYLKCWCVEVHPLCKICGYPFDEGEEDEEEETV